MNISPDEKNQPECPNENKRNHIETLRLVEMQFQLMLSVRLACSLKNQSLYVPDTWIFGNQKVEGHEIQLTLDEADEAATLLEHTIVHVLSLHIRRAILDTCGTPKEYKNADIISAFQISRLIRNAYSHSPNIPTWSIEANFQDKIFQIENVIHLNTKDLDNRAIRWQDYGGMISLWRLSQWVRLNVLNDVKDDLEEKKARYNSSHITQQGRCIITNEKSPLFLNNKEKLISNKREIIHKNGKKYLLIGKDSDGEYLLEIKPNNTPYK